MATDSSGATRPFKNFELNKIPLSVLAAILLIVGYNLAKPALFVKMYKMGWKQFLPFEDNLTIAKNNYDANNVVIQNAINVTSIPFTFSNLFPGTYIVRVFDAFGCSSQETFVISQFSAPIAVSSSGLLIPFMIRFS